MGRAFARFIAAVIILLAAGAGGIAPGFAAPLPQPEGRVILVIAGNISQENAPGEARFDRVMLEEMEQESFSTHTAITDGPRRFEGVPLKALLERVGASGSVIRAQALNAYEADIPFDDLRYGPIVALRMDGEVLKLRDKGPLWIVYPRDRHKELEDMRFDSRWVWQLNRLHVE